MGAPLYSAPLHGLLFKTFFWLPLASLRSSVKTAFSVRLCALCDLCGEPTSARLARRWLADIFGFSNRLASRMRFRRDGGKATALSGGSPYQKSPEICCRIIGKQKPRRFTTCACVRAQKNSFNPKIRQAGLTAVWAIMDEGL